MNTSLPPTRPARPLVVAAVVLLAAIAAFVLIVARGIDVRQIASDLVAFLRSAGPVFFFIGMALMPALGAPIAAFSLAAGPAFSDQLGVPTVMVLAMCALTVNMSASYLLARRLLRPAVVALLARFNYQLPQVNGRSINDLAVLLRITPGIPFPVQNYLLALAGVPFLRYLLISCVIAFPLNLALIAFGDALLKGNARAILIGFMVLVALLTGTQLLRRLYTPTARAHGDASRVPR